MNREIKMKNRSGLLSALFCSPSVKIKSFILTGLLVGLLFPVPSTGQTGESPLTNSGKIGPFSYNRSSPGMVWLPDISLISTVAGAVFRDDPGANGHNPGRTGFNLQEIELALQSVIDPYVRADIFFAFSEIGVELEEGYLTTLSLPARLQIRAGKIKMPFGRFNQKHLELWSFVNDPLINNRVFGGEGYNELALVPSVIFPAPFFLQLEGGFSQGDNTNNFDGTRKQDFAGMGRLSASFDISERTTFLVGGSTAIGFNDTGLGNLTHVFGGDFLVRWKPSTHAGISWQTEYLYRKREIPGSRETEGGAYTEVVGQLGKRWQIGSRADYIGLPDFTEKRWRVSPMARFMPSEFFSLRIQYDFEDANNATANHAGFFQAIFSMGPHGAHKF